MNYSQCEYVTQFFQWYASGKIPTKADRHPFQTPAQWEEEVKYWTVILQLLFDIAKERLIPEPSFAEEEERHVLRPLQQLFGKLVEPQRIYNLVGEAKHVSRLACIFATVEPLAFTTTCSSTMTHTILMFI